jgi:chromosome segregation ATPase
MPSIKKVNIKPSVDISPNKTISKTPSPKKNKTRKAITILENRQELLQSKIQENEKKINEYTKTIENNNNKINELQEREKENINLSVSEKDNIRKEKRKKNMHNAELFKRIDLLEAHIEKTEFLVKIWQSTKIKNDIRKKQLENEYTKKYNKFDKAVRSINNKIEELKQGDDESEYKKLKDEFTKITDDFERGYKIEIEKMIN